MSCFVVKCFLRSTFPRKHLFKYANPEKTTKRLNVLEINFL